MTLQSPSGNSPSQQQQQQQHQQQSSHNYPQNLSSTDSGFFPTCPSPVTMSSSPFNGFQSPVPHQQNSISPTNSSSNMHSKLEKHHHHNSESFDANSKSHKANNALLANGNTSGNISSTSPASGQQQGAHLGGGAGCTYSNGSESTPPLYPNGPNILNQRVKLNVGGKVFETLLSTLQKAGEESNLATVAKEAAIKDLPMFIDRDSDTFAILLNYLRTGQLLVPSWADFSTVQLLKLDAQFYGVHNNQYLNSLEHFNILKKFNYSVNVKFLVPELIVAEIKGATEGAKRKEAESKWLNWYKEDMLAFGKVFKASSISSFNAHFLPPHWCSLKVCFVLWNTNCNKEHIALFMKDLSKLHYIEDLEISEI